ncbi:hypothetical protein Hanom_Chr07g00609511 [Helianthus anomalus]
MIYIPFHQIFIKEGSSFVLSLSLSNPLMEFWFSGVQETPVGSAYGAGFVSTANNEQ